MGNRQNTQFSADNGIDDRKRKVFHDKTPLALTPDRAKQGVSDKQLHRLLELSQKGLRKLGAGTFAVESGRIRKIGFRLRMQQPDH